MGQPLYGRLLQYDALRMEFNEFRLKKDPTCPACGEAPTLTELIDYEGFCGVPAAETPPTDYSEISAADVDARRRAGDAFLLLDVRNPDEYEQSDDSTLILFCRRLSALTLRLF